MNTFVRREILDNSISGDKIFGGNINYVDGLYTDHLAVPHDAGPGGTGSINGAAFSIGLTERIAAVDSSLVTGENINVWSDDFISYSCMLLTTASQYGTLYLNDNGSFKVHLTANPALPSYLTDKLVIGDPTGISPGYKFEVPYDPSYFSVIDCLMANCTSVYANNFYFVDHSAFWMNIQDLSQLVDYLATNALAGGTGPLLQATLQLIVDDITPWQMGMINNIEDTIATANWMYLSSLNQNVGVGTAVNFGLIDVVDITATGDVIAATGDVKGERLLQTSGGMVLVPSQHKDIRGLHLDWYHPLGSGTQIRLVVEEGECIDDSRSVRMSLTSSMTKRLNAVWQAGDGNGGRAGSLATGYYYVFLIYNSSGGAVDVGFDASGTATNLLAASGYTHARMLGRTYWENTGVIISFFEDLYHYEYTDRPVRSGFIVTVSGSYVSAPFSVYAGAERFGKFAKMWIQAGSAASNSTELKYDFGAPRPVSLSNMSEVSSAPCNFLGGYSGDKVRPGEIVLNTTNSFLCKLWDNGGGSIEYDNFDNAGLKGLRENTAFTLYLHIDT